MPKNRSRGYRVDEDELREVLEEVFSRRTLMALYDLLNKGVIKRVYGVVAAGKEARIYWGKGKNEEDVAIKIFLVETAEFRRSMMRYIIGDPRFKHVRRDRWHIIKLWCSKEYKNLMRAYEAGIPVPRPISFKENVLVMEFIGKQGTPAPLIKDSPPEDPDRTMKEIINYIDVLFNRAKLVHADLSEYNIMNHDGRLYIIDWGSSVHISHPEAINFLRRDLMNIIRFFTELGAERVDIEKCIRRIISKQSLPPL